MCPLLPHFRRVKPKSSLKENWELLLCSHSAAYLLNCWSKMSWLFLLGRGTCQRLGEFEMKTACRSAGNLSANLSLAVDGLLGLQRERQRGETLLNPKCKAQMETIQWNKVWEGWVGKYCLIKLWLFLYEHAHLKKKHFAEEFFRMQDTVSYQG